ncbi:DUF5954 family protein [Streptomyces griseoluteus]|uniref:DUF5954 family protein n=1 Tax=Streptomyces griseoluteus TaxID=29306 RepID=UPI0036C77FCA
MRQEGAEPDGPRVIVRIPEEPVESVVEADALDAALRHHVLALRGPLFGVAAQSKPGGRQWRAVIEVARGCPQEARDGLNSLLWFRAKDECRNAADRRELLAAVTRLETECVNEVTVLGTRYRVVRAEEYAYVDAQGNIEPPRPSDPEPPVPDWSTRAGAPRVDDGLVLDPDEPLFPAQMVERLSLRGLAYSGSRFPDDVLHDSEQAVQSHPDVLLMPAAFRIVQRSGEGHWTLGSQLHATAHHARRTLDFSLTWLEPRERGLIPLESATEADARTVTADSASPSAADLALYVQAADRLRAESLDEIRVHGTTYRIARIRRLLRWGIDGPEGPRPSDASGHAPQAMHPRLDEDGKVQPD